MHVYRYPMAVLKRSNSSGTRYYLLLIKVYITCDKLLSPKHNIIILFLSI